MTSQPPQAPPPHAAHFRILALLAAVLTVFVWAVPVPAGAQAQTFDVKPGSWLSTGIQLKKGQSFAVTATGMLNYPNSNQPWGPDGYYQLGFFAYNLKGRFGAGNNTLFDIGVGGSFTAPIDGKLELGITHTYENIEANDSNIQGMFVVNVYPTAPATSGQPSAGSSAPATSGQPSAGSSAPATSGQPSPSAAQSAPAGLAAGLTCDTSVLQDSGQVTCSAGVTGEAANSNITYEWTVDGQVQPGATGNTLSLGGVSVGDHQVSVKASDTVNNVSADSPTVLFTRAGAGQTAQSPSLAPSQGSELPGTHPTGGGSSVLPLVAGLGAAAAAAIAGLLALNRRRRRPPVGDDGFEPRNQGECGDLLLQLDQDLNRTLNEMRQAVDERNDVSLHKANFEVTAAEMRSKAAELRWRIAHYDAEVAAGGTNMLLGMGFYSSLATMIGAVGTLATTVAARGIRAWRLFGLARKIYNNFQGLKVTIPAFSETIPGTNVQVDFPEYSIRIPYSKLPRLRQLGLDMVQFTRALSDAIDGAAKGYDDDLGRRAAEIDDLRRDAQSLYDRRERTHQNCLAAGNLPEGTWHRPAPSYSYGSDGSIIGIDQ
ncbi:hypothetical protein E6W39_08995 [Kitasatospora acidiphila]|uniref:Uncharacterized protein n=1 Tax=Kitasatospora acidiphila TaxID=2567942 RepID=A0A540W034_9ACTN|nr:hypothetical protein [Kitasatospora acidiphila]TQF02385.1 hypothetical protein E6W39_08995 [Kitasatospora acidiphila]